MPRHQTLTALLDWSYELLSEQERATLHSVAAFPGEFTLADAIGLGTGDGTREVEVVGAVDGLGSKSLATLDASGSVTRYRLPETTRAYVYEGAIGLVDPGQMDQRRGGVGTFVEGAVDAASNHCEHSPPTDILGAALCE